MFRYLRTIRDHRQLVADFVRRDLRARYVGSSMGFFWSVVFPIINLIVFTFVFRMILNARWSDFQDGTTVAVIMLMGIVIWSAFAESMSRCTNSLVENSNLIQKVVFPAEVLPTYMVISSLINMLISFPVVLAAVIWLGYVDPITDPAVLAKMAEAGDPGFNLGPSLVVLPLLLLLQGLLTAGLGMFFAAFNLFWRDTFHLMGVALTVWMFATPIFYPALAVERKGFGWLLDLNPMHWLIDSYRRIGLNGQWPEWSRLGMLALVSMLLLHLGSSFFRSQKNRFPDLL
ncbi:MAG: ABC transporter permease [Planctomycetota bacterium]